MLERRVDVKVSPDGPAAETGPRHNYTLEMPLNGVVRPEHVAVLNREYRKKFSVTEDPEKGVLLMHGQQLTDSQIHNLTLDVTFLLNNPDIPLANLCSRLDNYRPQTPSQRELLRKAKEFVRDFDPARPKGLYVTGNTGVGKTHIAIGIAKALMDKQQRHPLYVSGHDDRKIGQLGVDIDNNRIDAKYALIIDDVNNEYGNSWRALKKAAVNAYNYGSSLFVTSNRPYEEMLAHGFTSDRDEKPRFISRTQYLFDFVDVRDAADYRVTQHRRPRRPASVEKPQTDEATIAYDWNPVELLAPEVEGALNMGFKDTAPGYQARAILRLGDVNEARCREIFGYFDGTNKFLFGRLVSDPSVGLMQVGFPKADGGTEYGIAFGQHDSSSDRRYFDEFSLVVTTANILLAEKNLPQVPFERS